MIPRGLRNNNPGNIRLSCTPWKGEVRPPQDVSFCRFSTVAYGYRALIKLLQNYRTLHHCHTLADFIHRWAPLSENDTQGYVQCVCRELRVSPSYVPDVYDRHTMCLLAAAVSKVENGVPAQMADVIAGWRLL